MSKYYYHGIVNKECVNADNYSIKHMIPILTSEGIKSKRLLGIKESYGFNELDYVCICKKMMTFNVYFKNYNAFSKYVACGWSLIISNKVDAIKTEYIHSRKNISFDKRYSDLFDEYQVKDMISIKDIIGIAIPFKIIDDYIKLGDKNILKQIKTLIRVAKSLGLDIVDSSTRLFPLDYEFRKSLSLNNNIFIKNKLKKLVY